jgi:hypothetical protein
MAAVAGVPYGVSVFFVFTTPDWAYSAKLVGLFHLYHDDAHDVGWAYRIFRLPA